MVSRHKLLLVDDNPTNLTLLRELIDQNLPGCSAVLAEDGETALQLARQHDFDGAFIDVQMPGMDGLELCRHLKADPRLIDLPVVLITAHQSTAELRAMGLDAGAYDFISQPIRNVELLARIRAMLRIRATEAKLRESNQGLRKEIVRKTAALRWMTGLVAEGDTATAQLPEDTLELLGDLLEADTELDFELFRSQLFGLFPDPLQRTLGALALLEEVPVRLAEKLAVIDNVKGALDYLERHNFFVRYRVEGDCYQFLEPFRGFLRDQIQRLVGEREVRNLCRQAADWWLEQSRPALAVGSLLQGGDLREVDAVIQQVAPLLFGHGELMKLPLTSSSLAQDMIHRFPWLACCQGVALLEEQPRSGIVRLTKACEYFQTQGDRVGELFARAHLLRGTTIATGDLQLLGSLLQSTEQLLAEIGAACDEDLAIQVRLQLAFGSLLVDGSRGDIEPYLSAILEKPLLQEVPEYQATLRLVYGCQAFFAGNWRRCFRELEASAGFLMATGLSRLTRLALLVLRALVMNLLGDLNGFVHQKNQIRELVGTEFLEQTDLQPLLQLLNAQQMMVAGHWRQARELLEQGSIVGPDSGPHLESMRLQLKGLLLARDGEAADAARELRRSGELRDQAGGNFFLVRNRLLCSLGWIALQEYDEARNCLLTVFDSAANSGPRQLEALSAWLLSWLAAKSMGVEFIAATRRLVEELQPQEPCLVPVWYLPGMVPPLRDALSVCSEAKRLTELFSDHQGIALREDGEVVPALELQCLGGLSVRWQNQQVLNARDLPAAIRQLLALLLSAPGLQISQDEVQSLMWPDSSADRSRSKFDSLLLRTRKLLDDNLPGGHSRSYVTLQRGILSLEHCRIDAVEFERFGRAGIRHAKRREYWQAEGAFRRAFRLWRGEFNVGVSLDERADLYRQDLLLLFLECAQRWSEMLHLTGQDDEAVQIVQKALQCDPIQDGLVRFLHRVQVSHGRMVQAAQVLREYSQALEREGYSPEEIKGVLGEIEAEDR